jgi:predicted regulator of Ras-like GTPase activity (Roadblock/LC7/MglB family)
VAEAEIVDGNDDDRAEEIDQVLFRLLRYEEVLGAVAISSEGLVVGSAGVGSQDAEMVGALGAALVGALDRSARRLGAGAACDFSLGTEEGMVHVRNGGDLAVLLFTERCDPVAAGTVCEEALRVVSRSLA